MGEDMEDRQHQLACGYKALGFRANESAERCQVNSIRAKGQIVKPRRV
jgi:hypothetical protein